jgi:hypothetical protein
LHQQRHEAECLGRQGLSSGELEESVHEARLAYHLGSSNRQWRYGALGGLIRQAPEGKKDPRQKKERGKGQQYKN